jgi:hypothetical protein
VLTPRSTLPGALSPPMASSAMTASLGMCNGSIQQKNFGQRNNFG